MHSQVKEDVLSSGVLLNTISKLRAQLAEAWAANESLVQENCALRIAVVEGRSQSKPKPVKIISTDDFVKSGSQSRSLDPDRLNQSKSLTVRTPSKLSETQSSNIKTPGPQKLSQSNFNAKTTGLQSISSRGKPLLENHSYSYPETTPQHKAVDTPIHKLTRPAAIQARSAQDSGNSNLTESDSSLAVYYEHPSQGSSTNQDHDNTSYQPSSSEAESEAQSPDVPRPGTRLFSWGKPASQSVPVSRKSKSQSNQKNVRKSVQNVDDSSFTDGVTMGDSSILSDAPIYNLVPSSAASISAHGAKPLSNAHSDRVSFGSPESSKRKTGRTTSIEGADKISASIKSFADPSRPTKANQEMEQAHNTKEDENDEPDTTINDDLTKTLRENDPTHPKQDKSYPTHFGHPPSFREKENVEPQHLAQLSAVNNFFINPSSSRQVPVFKEPTHADTAPVTQPPSLIPVKRGPDTAFEQENIPSTSQSHWKPPVFSRAAVREEANWVSKLARIESKNPEYEPPSYMKPRKRVSSYRSQTEQDVPSKARSQPANNASPALVARSNNMLEATHKNDLTKPLPNTRALQPGARQQSLRRKLTKAYEKVDDASIVGYSSESQADISVVPPRSRGPSHFKV